MLRPEMADYGLKSTLASSRKGRKPFKSSCEQRAVEIDAAISCSRGRRVTAPPCCRSRIRTRTYLTRISDMRGGSPPCAAGSGPPSRYKVSRNESRKTFAHLFPRDGAEQMFPGGLFSVIVRPLLREPNGTHISGDILHRTENL